MDIKRKAEYPASELSNLSSHTFTFDGITFSSAEALLQSLKEKDPDTQARLWTLSGKEAWKEGQQRNLIWKSAQTLWWKGVAMEREGPEYQAFLDRVYDALLANADFCAALRATGNEPITHSIGKSDPKETILTERELCDRLMALRERLVTSEH